MNNLLVLFLSHRPGMRAGTGTVYMQSPAQYIHSWNVRDRHIWSRYYSDWLKDTGIKLKPDKYYALIAEPNKFGKYTLKLTVEHDRHYPSIKWHHVELWRNNKQQVVWCWGYGHKHFKKLGLNTTNLKPLSKLKNTAIGKVMRVNAVVVPAPTTPKFRW